MSEPTTLRAGDSVDWTVDQPEYSAAAGWALKYRLLFATGLPVDIATTGTATTYAAALTAAATAPFVTGQATLVKWVEKGLTKITLAQYPVSVLPNLAAATTLDGRSANVIALVAARKALSDYNAGGQSKVLTATLEGRAVTFRSVKELTDLIAYYQREVNIENANNAVLFGQSPGRVLTRM